MKLYIATFFILITTQLKAQSVPLELDKKNITVLLDSSLVLRNFDMNKAAKYANTAYDLSLKQKDTTHIIRALQYLAYHYSQSNNQRKALQFLYTGLNYTTDKSYDQKALLYKSIANCYNQYNDYERALKFYNVALDLLSENNNKKKITGVINNIAAIYYNQKNYEKSLKEIFKALKINKEGGDIEVLLFIYYNIGSVYLKMDSLDNALNYLNIHHKLAKKNNNNIQLLWSYNKFSSLYLKNKKYDLALNYSDSAIKIAKDINYIDILPGAYKTHSKINFEIGNYKEAYHDILYRNIISDSLNKIEKTNLAEDVSVHFKYNKQVKLLILEKENNQLHDRENKFKIITLILIISALLLITTIIILNYKNNIKAVKLKTQTIQLKLEKTNKELTSNILHLSNMNEFVNSISKRLEDEKNNFKPENVKSINTIIKDIQRNSNDSLWEEFELHFEKVHSNFYKNIQQDFSNLTANERKLCAFLKLNMSSKDISSITGQTTHSIEVARTRLRKKLGLSNKKESLIEFINGY